MKKKHNTSKVIARVKSLVNELDSGEKESLRDELLAFLLFGETTREHINAATESLKGLSKDEKELLRKLAEQTEALYKAHQKNDDEK